MRLEHDARVEAEKCAAVANAVLQALDYDPVLCSRGVAAMADTIRSRVCH
jgi:hypothetical protein